MCTYTALIKIQKFQDSTAFATVIILFQHFKVNFANGKLA